MGFIRKLIEKKERDARYLVDLYAADFRYKLLKDNIKDLNENIQTLSWYRKKEDSYDREKTIASIMSNIYSIKIQYEIFIEKYKAIEKVYKAYQEFCPDKLADRLLFIDTEIELKQLKENKKELRAEFEKTYNYFKRIVKNLKENNIPMNRILKQMRNAFDFDSSKLNSYDKEDSPCLKYRNFTTDEIWYIQ